MGNSRNQQGLTLVEVILTLLIFSVAFTAILLGLKEASVAKAESYEKMFATNLARQRLEGLKRFDESGNARNSAVWNYSRFSRLEKGITYFVETIPINNQTNADTQTFGTNSRLIPIRVTVSWRNAHNKSNSISVETCYVQAY